MKTLSDVVSKPAVMETSGTLASGSEAGQAAEMSSEQASLLPNASPVSLTPHMLSQTGPMGIRFDFQDGCRVWVPDGGKWRVRLRDAEADTIVFDQTLQQGSFVQSAKRYFVPYEIKIWKDDQEVFTHLYEAKDREILISMQLGGLGDQLAWMGHAAAFAQKHGCRLTCCVRTDLCALFAPVYPEISFISEIPQEPSFYAQYKVLVFFDDAQRNHQPNDYRQVGLAHMGAYILGLSATERRPEVSIAEGGRPIEERYVCVGTQASGLCKYWNNPEGWYQLVRWLKAQGYRVICIDQKRLGGTQLDWRAIPHGVEDQTGDRPLEERARWLKHADFFVGISSGLSWLAWAAGTPVVMISGFTEPYNEFFTPYRVINRHVCNSCANDVRVRLEPDDAYFCPHHKGTDRAFECGRSISVAQVKRIIETIPGFGRDAEEQAPKIQESHNASLELTSTLQQQPACREAKP